MVFLRLLNKINQAIAGLSVLDCSATSEFSGFLFQQLDELKNRIKDSDTDILHEYNFSIPDAHDFASKSIITYIK